MDREIKILKNSIEIGNVRTEGTGRIGHEEIQRQSWGSKAIRQQGEYEN
jgi:hypothetical protein